MTQRVPLPPALSVLIADADPYLCRVIEAVLAKNDAYCTMSVTTGQEALQAAERHTFHAVLWDMRLRDSASLLPLIRARCPEAALLLLTTDDQPTLEADLARLNVADILVKPLNLDALPEHLRRAIETPQQVAAVAPLNITAASQH